MPITEEHALRGQSPYSATKIAADKLAESYALSFDTPVTILRPFNTFGPRQSARAVIPTVLAQLLAGAEELRLGSITPQRDFTFVTDTALGFARAAVADVAPGTVVQLGTGRTVSIGEVVDIARRITGSKAEVVVEDERVRPSGSEVEILLSDPSLAKRTDRLDTAGGPRDRAAAHGRLDFRERRSRHGTPLPPMTEAREPSAPGAPGPAGTIPLATPNVGEAERLAVLAALDSGFVSSVGPEVSQFEQEFAELVGARHAVATASGTAALHVALRLAGVGPGDEVFVSDFTFIGSANPVAYLGAEVVLVDSETTSWNMDPDLLEQELDRRARAGEAMPRAIELVHVLGQPAEGHRIAEIARRHGVVLIEDAAESLGAGWVDDDGLVVSTGTLGALGAYSFNGNKIVTAGGGGMIVTDDDEAARRARAPDDPGQGSRCRLPARRGRATTTDSPTSPLRSAWPSSVGSTSSWPPSVTSRHATTQRSPISR